MAELTPYARRVLDTVDGIPWGRVLAYGDVAAWLGSGSGRVVGRVMAEHGHEVRWHRVLRADGTPAPGIAARQVALLRAEGVAVRDGRVDLDAARWDPRFGQRAWRPSADDLRAAYGRSVPDLVAPGLRVLLVGVNPSLWSGVTGLHFGRPANRLWPTLHRAGLTPRRLHPAETDDLLAAGVGVSNLVDRATARADEVPPDDLRAAPARVAALAARWRPAVVAVLGISAYRVAWAAPRAAPGPLPDPIGGRPAWLLPNPSGLNASYSQDALDAAFSALRSAAYA